MPATHTVHDEALEEYLPATHVVHVVEERLKECLPAGQTIHSAEPAWLLYLPAAHRTQVPPLGPDEPALHVQSSAESLLDGEFAKARQLEHAVADNGATAYFPAAHFVHSEAPVVQAHAHTAHVIVRYKTYVHFTRALIGAYGYTHQALCLWMHICMLCDICIYVIFHCLLHYIYAYRYHVDRYACTFRHECALYACTFRHEWDTQASEGEHTPLITHTTQ